MLWAHSHTTRDAFSPLHRLGSSLEKKIFPRLSVRLFLSVLFSLLLSILFPFFFRFLSTRDFDAIFYSFTAGRLYSGDEIRSSLFFTRFFLVSALRLFFFLLPLASLFFLMKNSTFHLLNTIFPFILDLTEKEKTLFLWSPNEDECAIADCEAPTLLSLYARMRPSAGWLPHIP